MPLTVLNTSLPVTADGEYALPPQDPGQPVVIEWDITAGTATVEPGYESLSGNYKPHRDVAGVKPAFGVEGGFLQADTPNSGKQALKVTGAAGGFSMKVYVGKAKR